MRLPKWLSGKKKKKKKKSTCQCNRHGSIPGSGRSLGGGNGNPLQYSCLDNPMGRGAWWATVHGIPKSRTRLSEHTHTHPQKCTVASEKVNPIHPPKKEGGEHLNKGGRIVLLSTLLRPGLWRTVSSYWSRICREKEPRRFFFFFFPAMANGGMILVFK